MKRLFFMLTSLSLALMGCGDGGPTFKNLSCDEVTTGTCLEIGSSAELQDAVNLLSDETTLILGAGTYELNNAVTIRNADGVTLIGQGMEETILDFSSTEAQANGVDVVGDRFTIEDLTILDAKKDGVRVEASDEVTFRAIKASWSTPGQSTNGAYGIYPVSSTRVLVEDCEAEHASDAGLYVGQSRHVIVRRNFVHHNVAGLEIENTQFADVHDNVVEDNTGGLVIFDLPGNPVIGRDVHVHDNMIRHNNHDNFAPGGTVAQIPPGTGTFALASRRLLIEGNTYADNNSTDIAILNGLALDVGGTPDPTRWDLDPAMLVGDNTDLVLDPSPSADGSIINLRSYDVVVGQNSHSGSGTDPNNGNGLNPLLGLYLQVLYAGDLPVDTILYDTLMESSFNAADAGMNSNDNAICAGADTNATFASLDLGTTAALLEMGMPIDTSMIFQPSSPFAPFDCTTFLSGGSGAVIAPDFSTAPSP